MRLVHLGTLLALCVVCSCFRSRRLRRQTLPSQHVQVHSLDSNVMYNDNVYVESTENRIDVNERNLNGSVWSDHSLLNFDSLDTFVNISADNAESYLSIQNGANLHGQAIKTNFYVHTNRTQGGQSSLSQSLDGDASFSIDDDTLRVQAVNGRKIAIQAETWQRTIEKKMVLSIDPTQEKRDLRLEAMGSTYHLLAAFANSLVFINFADKIIMIDPTFRTVEVFTDKFNVTVQAKGVPYDITLTQEEAIINLPTRRTRICINLQGVSVRSNNVAKTRVDRNGGEMTVGGKTVEANGATVIAKSTNLELNNAGQIIADMENSRFYVDNNVQRVGLTSSHHNLKIDQGSPHVNVDPGEACVDIVANKGLPRFGTIIPPFRPPPDKFGKIGPFPGDTKAENDFINRPSCCSSVTPIKIPDMGHPGVTRKPLPLSPEWSEWGNSGNNGGSHIDGSLTSWNTDGESHPDGGGGNPWVTWENSAKTPAPGISVDGQVRPPEWHQTGPREPSYGQWPTFSPLEEKEVTRGSWPVTFVFRDPAKADWEKETGCCKPTSKPHVVPKVTTIGVEVQTEKNPDEVITRAPMPVVTETQPQTEASTAPLQPLTEAPTAAPVTVAQPRIQPTQPTVKITFPTPPPSPVETTTSVSLVSATTFFPTNEWSGGSSSIETNTTESEPPRPRSTTQPNGGTAEIRNETATGKSVVTTMNPEDFVFAHYASTLFPEEIPIEATISTVNIVTPESENGFPSPSSLSATQLNGSEETSGDWVGGASDVLTGNVTEEFPSPQIDVSHLNMKKRSPLLLTLRVPRNVDPLNFEFSRSILDSLRKVIRVAAKRRIRKRELESDTNFVKINKMRSHEGTIEVEFDVSDGTPIDEGDLLSLSNQEISQFFDFPVVSLERVEELTFGDNRLLYIFIAVAGVVLTLCCVCCTFQTIIKQMSKSMLYGVSRRFSNAQPTSSPISYVNGSNY